MDAPLHFVNGGKSVDKIRIESLIGEVYVAEIMGTNEITARHLEAKRLPSGINRLLIKTDNSRLWLERPDVFYEDFAAFRADAAQWLVDKKIELVGIDYLSVQKYGDSPAVHRILLGAEVVVLEGLNLHEVSEGYYELICLPIKLVGIEAAPIRAVLRKREAKK
jgi:arylformamidase